jgi:hypothetical protein
MSVDKAMALLFVLLFAGQTIFPIQAIRLQSALVIWLVKTYTALFGKPPTPDHNAEYLKKVFLEQERYLLRLRFTSLLVTMIFAAYFLYST